MRRRQFLAGGLALPLLLSGEARSALRFGPPRQAVTPNGLTFLHLRSNVQDTVAIAVAFPGGNAADGLTGPLVSETGIALMFEGAGSLPQAEVVESFLDYGGSLWIEASADRTHLRLNAPSAGIAGAVDVANLVLTRPDFAENDLARVSANKVREAEQALVWPEVLLASAFAGAAMEPHPYFNAFVPDPARTGATQRSDVVAWHAARFVRKGAVICLVGDLDEAAAARLVDALFRDLPEGSAVAALPAVTWKPRPKAPIRLTADTGGQAALLIGGTYVPSLHLPDDIERLLLSTIFGQGLKSRLARAVREKLGSTYGLDASRDEDDHLGTFTVSGRVDAGKVEESIAAVLGVWNGMREGGPRDEEIRDARAYWNNEFGTIERKHSALASRLSNEAAVFTPLSDVGRARDFVRRVKIGTPKALAALFSADPLVLFATPG